MRGNALRTFEHFVAERGHENNYAGLWRVIIEPNLGTSFGPQGKPSETSQMSAISEDMSGLEARVFVMFQKASIKGQFLLCVCVPLLSAHFLKGGPEPSTLDDLCLGNVISKYFSKLRFGTS